MSNPEQPHQQTERFLTLYNLEQRRIYALIRAMLFDRSEAEDVFQETCLALWRSFAEFDPDTNFSAWAAQIARHRVLAHGKKRGSDLLVFGEETLTLISRDFISQPEVVDARKRALEQCIEKLPPKDGALLRRRYEVGVTTVKLSTETGRPLNTLYKSLQRIRRSLLTCIERRLHAEGASQ